jgi:hypothetical protein
MTTSDLTAGYGAVLATVLAALQVIQWKQSRRFVTLKHNEFYNNEDSMIEAIISNRGPSNVTLDFVAFGSSGRYIRSFWRREALNLCSILEIAEYGEDGATLGMAIDGRILKPGELVRIGVQRSRLEGMRRIGHLKGVFLLRSCFWIEHSQSDVEICHLIRDPK